MYIKNLTRNVLKGKFYYFKKTLTFIELMLIACRKINSAVVCNMVLEIIFLFVILIV